jgi:hypothetical protein
MPLHLFIHSPGGQHRYPSATHSSKSIVVSDGILSLVASTVVDRNSGGDESVLVKDLHCGVIVANLFFDFEGQVFGCFELLPCGSPREAIFLFLGQRSAVPLESHWVSL